MGLYEEQLPGVTLHLTNAEHGADIAGNRVVHITLDASISDEELWEDVKKKLQEGLRIYKGEDFHAAITDAVKADLADAQREVAELTRSLRQEKDARMLAEQDVERYKLPLSKLGEALRKRVG